MGVGAGSIKAFLQLDISDFDSKLSSATTKANAFVSSLNKANTSLQKTMSNSKNASSSINNLNTSLSKTSSINASANIDKTTNSLNKNNTSVNNTNKSFVDFNRHAATMKATSTQNAQALNRQNVQLSNMASQYGLVNSSGNRWKDNLGKTNNELDKGNTKAKQYSSTLSGLRNVVSIVASLFAYQFVHGLMQTVNATISAKSEMESLFGVLSKMSHATFGTAEINSFNAALDRTVKQFPKVNKFSLGETVAGLGVEFKLSAQEMQKAMPIVSMVSSEYLRAGRTVEEATLAVKDILQGEFMRLSRETGVGKEELIAAGWSGDNKDTMSLLSAIDKVGKSRGWDLFAQKATSLNDILLITKNRFGEFVSGLVETVTPGIVGAFNAILPIFDKLGKAWASLPKWGQQGLVYGLLAAVGGIGLAVALPRIISGFTNTVNSIGDTFDLLGKTVSKLGGTNIGAKLSGFFGKFGKSMTTVNTTTKTTTATTKAASITLKGFGQGILQMVAPLLQISIVIAIMIPVVTLLAAEALVCMRALGELVKALDFKSLNLKSQIRGIKEIGEAMWELARAFSAMMLVSVLTIIQSAIAPLSFIISPIRVAVDEIKKIVPIVNGLGSVSDINSEVVSKLKSLGTALKSVVEAIGAIRKVDDSVQTWNPFTNFVKSMESAKNDIVNSVKIVNDMGDMENISPEAPKKLKDIADALKSVSEAMVALGKVDETVNKGNWHGLGDFVHNLKAAKEDLWDAAEVIQTMADMPAIPKETADKIKIACESLVKIKDGINALGDVDWAINMGNWKGSDFVYALQIAKQDIWDAAEVIQTMADMPAIPEGVGNKIQRVGWSATNIVNALKSLSEVPSLDIDYAGIIVKMELAKKTLWDVSSKIVIIADMPAIPEGTGDKIQRVGWTLIHVTQAVNNLNNVPFVTVDNNNLHNAIEAIKKSIDELTTLNSKGSVDVTAVVDSVKNAITQINNVLSNAKSNVGSTAKGIGESISSGIKTGMGNLSATITPPFNTAMRGLASSAWTGGSKIGDSLTRGFQSAAKLTDSVKREVQNALNAANARTSEFWTAGSKAGNAWKRGYDDGAGIHSPGFIARHTEQEINYALGYMEQGVPQFYNIGTSLGSAFTESFNPDLVSRVTEVMSAVTQLQQQGNMGSSVDPMNPNINNPAMIQYQADAALAQQINTQTTMDTQLTFSSLGLILGTAYSNMANQQRNSLTTMQTQQSQGMKNVNSTTASNLNTMRNTTNVVTNQMTNAWLYMKDNIVTAASDLRSQSSSHFDRLSSRIGTFYNKLQNPSNWGGGYAGGSTNTISKNRSPSRFTSAMSRVSKVTNGFAGGTAPAWKLSKIVCDSSDCSDYFNLRNSPEKRLNIESFENMLVNGYGGWSDWSPKHFNHIKRTTGEWNMQGPTIDLVGGIPTGLAFQVKEFHDSNPNISFSSFQSMAEAIFNAIPYDLYMNSDKTGDWLSAMRSGAVNCWDGAHALIAFANTCGFSGSIAHGSWDGVPHVWAMINGKKMDTTGWQQRKDWAPSSSYGGPPSSWRHGNNNSTVFGGSSNSSTEVTVIIEGDVYGVDDLDAKIRQGVNKGLNEVINENNAIGI